MITLVLPIHQIYSLINHSQCQLINTRNSQKRIFMYIYSKSEMNACSFFNSPTPYSWIFYITHTLFCYSKDRLWHVNDILNRFFFYSWKKRSWNFQELLKSSFEMNKNPSSSFCKSVFVRLFMCAGEVFIVKRIIINIRNMKSQDFNKVLRKSNFFTGLSFSIRLK